MKRKTKASVFVSDTKHRLMVSDEQVLCDQCSLYDICKPTLFEDVICAEYTANMKFSENKFYYFEIEK